jgi:hypothetical protein
MKWFVKTLILVGISLWIMDIIQHVLEVYAKIPREYAGDIVTYPGIVVTILVMEALKKKGWL